MLVACARAAPQPPAIVCPPVARACDPRVADADAVAIVRRRCTPCHAPGGAAGSPLVDVLALRAAPIGDALAACEMPPRGRVLEPGERARLVAWDACGTSSHARPDAPPADAAGDGHRELNSFLYSP